MSRASTPDALDDIFAAMTQSSPAAPAKRTHSAMADENSDHEDDAPVTTAAPSTNVNQNIVAAANTYADRKRIRADQKAKVAAFLNEPPSLREAKLLVNLFVVENLVNNIVVATPAYEPSDALIKNIYSLGAAIFLSSKISTYKGATPTNILLNILKQRRFDLPAGIENNAADWEKVIKAVQDALTQLRAKFKKAIEASLKTDKKNAKGAYAPGPQQQNIFQLTHTFVGGANCTVNVLLCAQVALMRKVYLTNLGPKFWDGLDEKLASIRTKADGDSHKISRAFRHILKTDRQTHGENNYELDDGVDAFQQQVDDVIAAGVTDGTSTQAQDQPEQAGDA
ncbi:hypothetical protein C8J57DRAFT_1468565 [Mycena rebaudengoi]|nr:hypothetical protein C8J57DRAFT_1468565 [Mycena rebaudengoi]